MAKAFISYSHRDEKALERLHTHLATLRREGKITTWYDREIIAGEEIDSAIASNLAESDIFLALVSPDFLDSNYCYEQEMAKALERHAEGTLRVIPVILEPCDWKSTPLGKLKALPKDGKAIYTWTNENIAYLDVVTGLRRMSLEQEKPKQNGARENEAVPLSSKRETRRYRIKKEFDSIDRDDFRQKAFLTIQNFFSQSVRELNEIDDSKRRTEKRKLTDYGREIIVDVDVIDVIIPFDGWPKSFHLAPSSCRIIETPVTINNDSTIQISFLDDQNLEQNVNSFIQGVTGNLNTLGMELQRIGSQMLQAAQLVANQRLQQIRERKERDKTRSFPIE
jgi:hypothetical protein